MHNRTKLRKARKVLIEKLKSRMDPIAANGMIFAEVDLADAAREIDFAELLDAIDVATIANAHEVTKWPPPRPAGSRARV